MSETITPFFMFSAFKQATKEKKKSKSKNLKKENEN